MGTDKNTVLKVKNVSVVFDGFQALTDVNVEVKRKTIHFFHRSKRSWKNNTS